MLSRDDPFVTVEPGDARVLNSLAANRRLVFRVASAQVLVATGLAGLYALLQGVRPGLAAAVGGLAIALGTLVMGWASLSRAGTSPGAALGRLLFGIVFRWVVVIGALLLALAPFGLPPLPLLAGLVGTLAVTVLIHKLDAQVFRER